jgi:hypothetical protein
VCAAFLAAALALLVAGLALTVVTYPDLRWKRYKAIGAEVSTRALFARWEALVALRSLDFQNSLVVALTGLIFFAGAPARGAPLALGLACALIAVEAAWEVAGDAAVRRESRAALAVFFALSPLTPAYIVWVAAVSLSGGGLFADVRASPSVLITVAVFGVLSLATRAATVALCAVLAASFGQPYRGLRRLLAAGGTAALLRRFDRGRVREWGSARDAADAGGADADAAPSASAAGTGGGSSAGGSAVDDLSDGDGGGTELTASAVSVKSTANPFATAMAEQAQAHGGGRGVR